MIGKEAVETGKEKLKESTFFLPSQGAYYRDMCGIMRSCKRTISLAKGTMYTLRFAAKQVLTWRYVWLAFFGR